MRSDSAPVPALPVTGAAKPRRADGMLRSRAVRRFLRHRLAVASLLFLLLVSALALLAPWAAPYEYDAQDIASKLQGPSWKHWMGTDSLGRGLFSRVIWGARVSLQVGFLTALFALVLGTATGAVAVYRGGWVDHLLSRVVDLFYIFPSLLLAILLMVAIGAGAAGGDGGDGTLGIVLALGLVAWVTQARLVRGQVLQAREMTYVEAARAMGVRSHVIIARHILPNILGPIIVSVTFQIPTNILAESFLSFIGLGIQPPHSSWGTLANEGFRAMRSYPHLILFPGIVLFLTMLAFNYLGDGLRDVLDPKGKDPG
jgi:oligopeptide transport system permease protein